MMSPLLIKGFAGAVLGGLGSLGSVFVGGLMLGVIENLMSAYISASFSEALSFLLIIFVLIVAPSGIFGRVKTKKV
jgi:branched-subunit amino acid ABC-type transport system permease component